jgi:hypothetical protein
VESSFLYGGALDFAAHSTSNNTFRRWGCITFDTSIWSAPSPIPAEPLVLSLQDARSVDLLAITNDFEGRPIKKEYSTDTSCTLGTQDSARSGDWCEYQKGKKMGMDLTDSFIDDSEMDQIFRDFKPL